MIPPQSPIDRSPVDESPIDQSPIDQSPIDQSQSPIDNRPFTKRPDHRSHRHPPTSDDVSTQPPTPRPQLSTPLPGIDHNTTTTPDPLPFGDTQNTQDIHPTLSTKSTASDPTISPGPSPTPPRLRRSSRIRRPPTRLYSKLEETL